MTTTRFILASAPALLIAAAGTLAQTTTQPERQDRPIHTQPGMQAGQPDHKADKAMKGMALRVTKVDNATLVDSAGADVGEIDDLLVDTGTGRVVYAVVARGGVMGIGEERHAVPWKLVKAASVGEPEAADDDDGDLDVDIGADDELRFTLEQGVSLEGAPSFTMTTRPDFNDPAWNRQIHDHYKVEQKHDDMGEKPDMADKPAGVQPGIAAVDRPVRLSLASEFTNTEVENLQEEEFGQIADAVFNARSGKINYVVISAGGFLGIGEEYAAVPFNALQIRPEEPDDQDNLVAILNIDEERFRNAPRFAKDDWPDFNDRTWGEPVHRYYGTEPFWLEDDDMLDDDIVEDDAELDPGAMPPPGGEDRSVTLFKQGQTTDVSGAVSDVRKDATFEGLGSATQITVDGDEGPMLVLLAPSSFLQEHDLQIASGDTVTITGAKVNVGGRDVILARTIEKDGTSVTLRDEQGRPQWPGR